MEDGLKSNDQMKCVQGPEVAILPLSYTAKNGISHAEHLLISLKGQTTRWLLLINIYLNISKAILNLYKMITQYLSHWTVFITNNIFTHKDDIGLHTTAKFTNIYNLEQKYWEQLKYYLLIYGLFNDAVSTS